MWIRNNGFGGINIQQYQPCEGMTETQIALPTLQDKTAIVGTREEDQVLYPTLEALFKRQ